MDITKVNDTLFLDHFSSEILPKEFLEKYINKTAPFGYNGLGYIVYKRTYARLLPEGTETEEWWQTIARCINGAQKIGAKYTIEEAQRLYDLMFNLKCSYAGRMLWQLGTTTVDRFGMNSLINCYFIAIKDIEDFCFLFENLMLGGGVGFSVKREDIHELPKIKKGVVITHKKTNDADYIVPDSREGWVRLLRNVLKAHFIKGESFTYSTILIREYGAKISGFGGQASGPGILIEGIESICKIIQKREGKKLRSVDVLDICNIIGSIVVAGNVRRSAEIAMGDSDDVLFLRAKRWDLGNIPNWRAMSNNTIYADSYDYISDSVWDGFNGNGEPYGFFNLPLAQSVGRLGEERKDNCTGMNPCLPGDTLIYTDKGQVELKSLIESPESINVLSKTNTEQLEHQLVLNRGLTKINANLIKLNLKDGSFVKLTPDHKIFEKTKGWISASEIRKGDVVLKLEN